MTDIQRAREAAGGEVTEPRTDWRIEQEADGDWSLYYRGDGVTTPVHGFAATIPAEDDAQQLDTSPQTDNVLADDGYPSAEIHRALFGVDE